MLTTCEKEIQYMNFSQLYTSEQTAFKNMLRIIDSSANLVTVFGDGYCLIYVLSEYSKRHDQTHEKPPQIMKEEYRYIVMFLFCCHVKRKRFLFFILLDGKFQLL